MTPAQAIQKLGITAEVCPVPIIDMEVRPQFTSTIPEEDLDAAVELLMAAPRFLEFLRDADKHFDILGAKAKDELAQHIDDIQEFLGLWINE